MQMKHKKFDPNKFKKIVQRHVRAHEYFEKFSNLYGPGLIVKFIMVGTSLCVHGFVLLEVEVRIRISFEYLICHILVSER